MCWLNFVAVNDVLRSAHFRSALRNQIMHGATVCKRKYMLRPVLLNFECCALNDSAQPLPKCYLLPARINNVLRSDLNSKKKKRKTFQRTFFRTHLIDPDQRRLLKKKKFKRGFTLKKPPTLIQFKTYVFRSLNFYRKNLSINHFYFSSQEVTKILENLKTFMSKNVLAGSCYP